MNMSIITNKTYSHPDFPPESRTEIMDWWGLKVCKDVVN